MHYHRQSLVERWPPGMSVMNWQHAQKREGWIGFVAQDQMTFQTTVQDLQPGSSWVKKVPANFGKHRFWHAFGEGRLILIQQQNPVHGLTVSKH